jgi:PEGA domain
VNDSSSTRSAAYAQVRVREPLGERVLGETVSLGGANAANAAGLDTDILLPGAAPGPAATIERRKGIWVVAPRANTVRCNGRPLTEPRDLHKNDALSIADAQIVVRDASRTLLRIDVHHLAGNDTIAPATALATLVNEDSGDEDLEIHPLERLRIVSLATSNERVEARALAPPISPRRWLIAAAVVTVLALIAAVASRLVPVAVDIRPVDARILTPGTLLTIHEDNHLLLLPGKHLIRAEHAGYIAAETGIEVGTDGPGNVRLRLEKLPGRLNVDTGGIAATVSVDGVEVGRAPGVLSIPAGSRTIMISAPRYVDYIANVTIAGAGELQSLRANLQTSWGALKVLSNPEGALVSIDGVEGGTAPVTIRAPSGVRRVQMALTGRKSWESSVVLKAGETLTVGPVMLGQPDAHLALRSDPAGADATVAGTHLGRTPAEIDLPSGIAHQVVLSAPGYRNWVRAVFAEPGRKLSLFARLEPILGRVTVQGDPADAELLVDGKARGKAPQSLELPATEHRVEVRKTGFQTFKSLVTPAAGLDRTVQYHLVPTNTAR